MTQEADNRNLPTKGHCGSIMTPYPAQPYCFPPRLSLPELYQLWHQGKSGLAYLDVFMKMQSCDVSHPKQSHECTSRDALKYLGVSAPQKMKEKKCSILKKLPLLAASYRKVGVKTFLYYLPLCHLSFVTKSYAGQISGLFFCLICTLFVWLQSSSIQTKHEKSFLTCAPLGVEQFRRRSTCAGRVDFYSFVFVLSQSVLTGGHPSRQKQTQSRRPWWMKWAPGIGALLCLRKQTPCSGGTWALSVVREATL